MGKIIIIIAFGGAPCPCECHHREPVPAWVMRRDYVVPTPDERAAKMRRQEDEERRRDDPYRWILYGAGG